MKKLIISFETFQIVIDIPKRGCEIWMHGFPQWYGTVEQLEKLLLEAVS